MIDSIDMISISILIMYTYIMYIYIYIIDHKYSDILLNLK